MRLIAILAVFIAIFEFVMIVGLWRDGLEYQREISDCNSSLHSLVNDYEWKAQ